MRIVAFIAALAATCAAIAGAYAAFGHGASLCIGLACIALGFLTNLVSDTAEQQAGSAAVFAAGMAHLALSA